MTSMRPAEVATAGGGLVQSRPVYANEDKVNISQQAVTRASENAETVSAMDEAVRGIKDAFALANDVVSGMKNNPVAAAAAQSANINVGSAIGSLG